MSDVVLDSCVLFKCVQPEADSAQAEQILQAVPAAGGRLIVLELALSETINAIWKRHHRKLITTAEAIDALALLRRAPIEVRPAEPLLEQALALAMRFDRPVYDALFVALAVDIGTSGVTSDEPLYHAVKFDHPQIHLLRSWPPAGS